jgi:hypothetical protein
MIESRTIDGELTVGETPYRVEADFEVSTRTSRDSLEHFGTPCTLVSSEMTVVCQSIRVWDCDGQRRVAKPYRPALMEVLNEWLEEQKDALYERLEA